MKPLGLAALSPLGAASRNILAAEAHDRLLASLRGSDLDETGAFLAWQLAALARGLAPGERDSLALLVGRLLVAAAAGSTRLLLDERDRALLAKAPELAGAGKAHTPLVVEGGHLYTARAHACEVRVAQALATRLARRGPFVKADLERAVDEVAKLSSPAPSDEQKKAAVSALGRRLGVISGGPGTGKTTTALVLVRSLVRLGVPAGRIALAAPTGKAKSRLEEDFRTRLVGLARPPQADRDLLALCPEAQTLHHLLGATPGPGGHLRAARDPLPYQAVIVDESSMIDLVLMDWLLSALADDAHLILLGDADQLPSVSAGAVFRDVADSAVHLERGFRADPSRPAGSQLVALARAVREGQADKAAELCLARDSIAELRRQGVERLEPDQRDDLLGQYHQRTFAAPEAARLIARAYTLDGATFSQESSHALDQLLALLGRARVLGVTRQGPAGVENCNHFLHRLHGGERHFLPGEPVLMLQNDYERELWNGDQGIAVRVELPGHRFATRVAFPSRQGWLAVDPLAMGSALDLGFALTVHKAQGSEWDEVLLLLPDSACPLLTRELVYTALSRARESIVVCGSCDAFATAVASAESRASGIAERLKKA
jgi:exodeoxyribonuclease V alpha subunit